ncbi:hypothetical protein C8Q75DRAFT_780533 [Abortiporus biennis]|nr:hypothetical protein C8Q75DRAFT_780533 [Abortiporus biennis]
MPDVIDLTDLGDSDLDDDHDSERSVTPLDDQENQQLQVAIENTPQDRLRESLAYLALREPFVGRKLFEQLVVVREDGGEGDREAEAEGGEADGDVEELGPIPPELMTRWAVCANCGEDYDTGIPRADDECIYHPGILEVNESAFPDWDEEVHGPMDTKDNRIQYPDGFTWTCCNKDGTTDGCESDQHRPGGSRKKKRRFG